MGAKTEALAGRLEEKARDAVATLVKLGDADWKRVTAAEKWTVGVTAHHLAGGLEAVAGIVTAAWREEVVFAPLSAVDGPGESP